MKIKLAHPLVSCICITYNRPNMLLRAIYGFLTQNYPNKELVISCPANDSATKEIVQKISAIGHQNIILIERVPSMSIGTARNIAVEGSNGEYICTWDDDDLHHYDRILHQFNEMQGKYYEAGILSRIYLYDTMTQRAFRSAEYNWGGTLICRKDLILMYPYLNTNFAEDTHLINSLESREILYKINTTPFLYIFTYHQNNVLDYFYFQHFLYYSHLLNQDNRDFIRNEVKKEYLIRNE